MARARSIQSGDATAGVRVEYLKGRRVFRLGGWHGGGRAISPVEVPASRFLDDLGIAPEEMAAVPTYMVLAYVHDTVRGAHCHLAAAFPSELEARQVFASLRAEHRDPEEWAQVVALDARCRLIPVCWFGKPPELNNAGFESLATRRAATLSGHHRPLSSIVDPPRRRQA